jgi:hypothetical protein
VVFFAFTKHAKDDIRYYLSAVATVAAKLDRRSVYSDPRLGGYGHLYVNVLIRPDGAAWIYDESDRQPRARHGDWLWRIARHDGSKAAFESKYAKVYSARQLGTEPPLAENYILFSQLSSETHICSHPPFVAAAERGRYEVWRDPQLRALTVGQAGAFLPNGRDYLRSANPSGRNVHPEIHFRMPFKEAALWRQSLIEILKSRDTARLHERVKPS